MSRARLMTMAQEESGAWLNALPFSSLGLYWTLKALWWSSPLEWALMIVFLILAAAAGGWTEEVCTMHGLSSKYSAGRFPRHSAMNDVIKRALQKPACHRFWRLRGSIEEMDQALMV